MSTIITRDLENEFKSVRTNTVINRRLADHGNSGSMMRSAIVDKTSLPGRIQRKMGSAMPTGSSGVNMKMGNPTFYHPLFQPVNMMLPRDRRERNEWCRHFYRTEPIIGTSLDLHTEYPISDFNNQCSDKAIKEFFDYMAFDKLDILNLLLGIGHEYWKIGDVFPFGQLNESEGMWEKFVILNPDYVDIQSSIFADDAIIEMLPDESIKAIVTEGPRGANAELYNQLPEDVIRQIKMGRNIRLDNRLVSHIAHKASDYEVWGTPLQMRCFKTLIYKDKLRGAQDAIANRHIFPIRCAKIGQPGEPMPSQDDLDNFRDTLMMADEDPNFFIVYHYGLQFDYVGSSGKILPLNQEFDFIQKELMNGLGINQALLNGEGPTYANAQVGMDALAKRYMSYRYKLETWIKNKIYRPIAEIQGFYKPVNGEISTAYLSDKEIRRLAARKDMQLIIPEIRWQQQDLTSNQSAINLIQQLQNKGLVSTTTIHQIVGLDAETEKKNLETERGTVFDPNAPKTGPLPNPAGAHGTAAPTPGNAPPSAGADNAPAPSTAPPGPKSPPTPPSATKPGAPAPAPNGPAHKGPAPQAPGHNKPGDFGFPKKKSSVTDFFEKRGETETLTTSSQPSSSSPAIRVKRRPPEKE